jgi:5-methylcytosine-specific restriction endonuclease McrA
VTNSPLERREYRQRPCQLCGKRQSDHVHEIASGPARKEALKHRAAWLALCESCHRRMHDHSDFPIERQCALKLLVDPEYFNLEVICRLRGRAPTAITLADVAPFLELKDA